MQRFGIASSARTSARSCKAQFLDLERAGALPTATRQVNEVMRRLYEERMRLTGQNGLSDYDVGFTNFLYTFEHSSTARQTPPPAGVILR